jgi:sialate O-acetylesterase
MARCFLPRAGRCALALLLVSSVESASRAQLGGSVKITGGVSIKEPVASRVYQRDRSGRADIPIVLDLAEVDGKPTDAAIVSAQLYSQADRGSPSQPAIAVKFADGKLTGVPTGGPYQLNCTVHVGETQVKLSVGPLFVGDLWVLAGQSNMQGVGDLIDVTPPDPEVIALGMDGNWVRAEEPLHWLLDSPDPVHSGDAATRAERSKAEHKTRTKGAGLGLPFAVTLNQHTGVPIGLVVCGHGGTSMEQWSPAKKGDGGKSLYGSMLRQVNLAGGKVKGVLWYQGESDANESASKVYPKVFADFIVAVRDDFHQPELPFYLVQIGRFVTGGDPRGWKAVQEAERLIPERVPNTAVVSVIDLELDDAIHVGTQGLKRTGRRLALIALREVYGQVGGTTPNLDKVMKGPGHSLVVKLKGVNMGTGMGGMMGTGMGGMMGMGMGGRGVGGGMRSVPPQSPGDLTEFGLRPARHIAGFSIRKEDGAEIPLIFEAAVGQARDTVILKLTGEIPKGAQLWFGYGYDPYCNLTDSLDMAVPAFGPVALDDLK